MISVSVFGSCYHKVLRVSPRDVSECGPRGQCRSARSLNVELRM